MDTASQPSLRCRDTLRKKEAHPSDGCSGGLLPVCTKDSPLRTQRSWLTVPPDVTLLILIVLLSVLNWNCTVTFWFA